MDKSTAIATVKQNGLALEHVVLNSDPDVVMAAVQENGLALQFASFSLRNNNEVVMAAITNEPTALQYAGENPRDVDDIVFYAVGQNKTCIHDASKRIRDVILLDWVEQNPDYIDHIHKPYITKKIALAALRQNGMLYRNLPVRLKHIPDIVTAALENNGRSIMYMVEHDLFGHKDYLLLALQTYGLALKYATDELKADPDVVFAAVQQDGNALPFSKYKDPLITMMASLKGYHPTPADHTFILT